ncbi:MAG: insulinase family protein [Ignavibacteria bacterium]|nr:insulinase family protein [Ignavibacteria bacterium]
MIHRFINSSAGDAASPSGAGFPVEPAVRTTVLPSGLTVLSERVASVRSVALGCWLNVGSRDEAPSQNGISHFIEHAVFKGTRKRKTHQIAQYLDAVGGYVNAFTGKDTTCYYARILDSHVGRAVELLSDLILAPAFSEKEIRKEKMVIAEEMRSIEDDPEDIINDHFEALLFGAHPLGQPVIGTLAAVEALDRDALVRAVAERHTARNLVVSASGNVEHERLVGLCARAFADLPAGVPPHRVRPAARPPRHTRLSRSMQQTHAIFGRRVPGARHADSDALLLLNALLGDGMASRLFQRVRERHGYAYNIYSFATLYEDAGVFGVYLCADQSTVEKSVDLIRRELDDLRVAPVSARELRRTKEQVIGSTMLGLESMSTRMSRLAKDHLYYGRVTPVEEIVRRIENVSAADIQRVAVHACAHERYSSVTIDPVQE